MKNFILLIFLLITSRGLSQSDSNFNNYGDIDIGSTQYLLPDNVNLRSGPFSNSGIVKILPIGSTVKVIAKTDSVSTINGYKHNWYKVVVLDALKKETGDKGYLWGGFFAFGILKASNDPSVVFLYGISKIVETNLRNNLFLQIRAIKDFKELSKLEFESVSNEIKTFEVKVLGNKEVLNVNEIIDFDYNDVGLLFGHVYVFWDRVVLHHARTLRSYLECPYFDDQTFIFPNDEGGKAGRIIYLEQRGEALDDGKTKFDVNKRTELIWRGCDFIEVK